MHHHPLYEFVRICFTLTARVVFTQTYTALPTRVVVFGLRRRRRRVFIMCTYTFIYTQLYMLTNTRGVCIHIHVCIICSPVKRKEREKSDFVLFFSPYAYIMYIQ
jgi:hypothetical protein